MVFLLAMTGLLPQSNPSVDLYQGAEIPGQIVRYFGVEDTTLDPSQPNDSFGGIAFLKGGSGKTILIRFSDLRRALGDRKKIRSAKLILTPTAPSQTKLERASEVLVEWHEGPAYVVNFGNLNAENSKAARGAATFKWRQAGASPEPWKGMGATGLGESARLQNAKLSFLDRGEFEISGIESAIQKSYESPFQIGGIALQFSSACEFYSAQSPQFSPVLRVELETVPADSGADLSITKITRTPWPAKPQNSTDPAAPAVGTNLTLEAEIQNVGASPCTGIKFRWFSKGSWGTWVQEDRPIAPGATRKVNYSLPYEPEKDEPGGGKIALEVVSQSPESNLANNVVEFPIQGLGVQIKIPEKWNSKGLCRGSSSPFDAAQALIELFNQVLFPRSQYSFAPAGCVERIYINGFNQENSESADFSLELSENWNDNVANLATLLSPMHSGNSKALLPGSSESVFGGITGSGETRFDGAIPRTFFIPSEPVSNPLLNIALPAPTGLLSMTEVYGLNQDLGVRGVRRGSYIQNCPILTLFKAFDLSGQPLANSKLSVFHVTESGVKESAPFATVTTDFGGGFQIPKQTVDGKPCAHPFGKQIPGSIATQELIFELESGSRATRKLHSWQILDCFARAGANPAVFEIRFNTSDSPIEATNLALNKIVTSSESGTPLAQEPVIDGNTSSSKSLQGKNGAWIELDLGRDRAIGEIRLSYALNKFWTEFEIQGYNTGQKPEEAISWSKIRNSNLTAQFWGSPSATGIYSVPLRSIAKRFRYIRIKNLRESATAELNEIEVFGAKISN